MDSLGDYGESITHTTEHGDHTTYGDEASEPTLDEAQIDLQSLDFAAPAPSYTKRGMSSSGASRVDSSQGAHISSGRPSNSSKMPEFFSHATFQIVLANPTIAHQLLKYGESRLCGENLAFLARVARYHALLAEVSKSIYEIHKDFISSNAPSQINIAEQLLLRTNKEMKASLTSTLPALETVFVDAQADIERLVYTDLYPNFVRHQMTLSAAKALGGDRAKYAGLGDCFVLTDPARADNPIVYASDGFVKVTGYSRNEIIPRNCRFLQNRNTDRAAVRRLKTAIDKRQESVELLLNQKKNGDPFWNLLYTTPLYDGYGKLAFFLGGQINCSTTVHNASDVLRILGQSKEVDDSAVPAAVTPQLVKRPRRSILSAFRSNSMPIMPPRAAGMENNLLNRIEDMPLKNQMETFYTAYSHVRHSLHFLLRIKS